LDEEVTKSESLIEDIAVSKAFEHPAEELELSRSRHFMHGGTNES
jgi:hypothetical protein